jgi:predicted glycogen debranching enzyme
MMGAGGRGARPVRGNMIAFDQSVCSNLEFALQREWLETNGLGGYASSTIAGCHTRRYHGLLIAAARPPAGRLVLLSQVEETLVLGGRRFELSVNRFPGVIHPQGHRLLIRFRLDPFPVYTFAAGGIEIEKFVFMVHGENTTVIRYELRSRNGSGELPGDCALELRPLIAFRDYHSTTHENSALDRRVETAPGLATVAPYHGLPALHFAHDAAEIEIAGCWWRNFEYEAERERGLDYREDLFNPFAAKFVFSTIVRNGPATATLIASMEKRQAGSAEEMRRAEAERRRQIADCAPLEAPLVRPLAAAADQFIVSRGEGKTILAGYHWFLDWGRDAMIALPGLTLLTGRPDIAKSILLNFVRWLDRGMLPNRFPDSGEAPEYNTIDAALWFCDAVGKLAHYTGDYAFVRSRLYPALAEIVDWHVRGTRYGIRVDADGLLASGEPGVPLTWMDAKVGERAVTPRCGKAVEIQALWYNALRITEEMAGRFGDAANKIRCGEMGDLAARSFNAEFWNASAGCLFDVVNGSERDGSIRPNQVFAASLRYTMLSDEKARSVLQVIERDLLTPYGLRTLAPQDPQYRGRYEGDPQSRDSAYHQGTVWPWLLGPFLTAYMRVNGRTKEAREQGRRWLAAFEGHLCEAGLGQISEIFDGDAPHAPRGCIAQAWSVAEVLRAAVEDVFEPAGAASRRPAGGFRICD